MQKSSRGWKDLADLQVRVGDITECGTDSDVNIRDSPNPKRTHLPPGARQVTEMCGVGTVTGNWQVDVLTKGTILE